MPVPLRLLVAMATSLATSSLPAGAQSPKPSAAPPPAAPPPAAPKAPIKQPAGGAPAEKPEVKKSGKGNGKKSKRDKEKEEKKTSGFDPKSFLLKLVLNADEDGDGALSTAEFRKVPLLKELKKERVDSLFADIDADSNASLDADEIGKGFGKITDLAKESRSLLDDEDAAKQAKKLKRPAQ